MQSGRFAGYFMLVTSVIVAIPVILQLRARESDWRHVWSPILFIIGLAVVGCAYAFVSPPIQKSLAIAGVAAMLVGMFFAQKTSKHREN
jgi:hypothetical protein